jgi:hypothetical protein
LAFYNPFIFYTLNSWSVGLNFGFCCVLFSNRNRWDVI